MRKDQWENQGLRKQANRLLCFLFPVGGAKLLEEEKETAKLKS
jgi:hypothetical protein